MKNSKYIDPFINVLPSIDVHGYTYDTVFVPINDFINDNIKLNKKKIVIIHGVGKHVLRNRIKELFKNDKRVKNLYIPISNYGCTIIELY